MCRLPRWFLLLPRLPSPCALTGVAGAQCPERGKPYKVSSMGVELANSFYGQRYGEDEKFRPLKADDALCSKHYQARSPALRR